MEFVETNDDIQTIDITSKNKWKWAWVENTALEHVIRKTRRDGLAWCCICKQTLKYGSSGKKALWRHIDTPQHTQAVEYVKKNKRSIIKVGIKKTGSASDATNIEKLHQDIRTLCNELEERGYESLVVVTSGAEHTKIGSVRGQKFLENYSDFIEEFCFYCRDNTSSDKDESTGTPGPNSEEPFKVTSSQAKKEISKLHVLKEEYSPEIDDEVKKLVERVTNDILDPAKSESVSEDNRKMDSNETDDYDDVNNNADIDDDGDGSMLRR